MKNEDYLVFLKGLLIKIENVINLIEQDSPKHIPAYNKMLGVRQKIADLEKEYRNKLFPQSVCVRSIINNLLNGRYPDAHNKIIRLKQDLINIYISVENYERDKNKEISKKDG